jgi:hypothetical protein
MIPGRALRPNVEASNRGPQALHRELDLRTAQFTPTLKRGICVSSRSPIEKPLAVQERLIS